MALIKYISDEEHYNEVLSRVVSVKTSLWIGTADIKDLYVKNGTVQAAMNHFDRLSEEQWNKIQKTSDFRGSENLRSCFEMVPEFYHAEFSRRFRLWKRERSGGYVTDDKDENGLNGYDILDKAQKKKLFWFTTLRCRGYVFDPSREARCGVCCDYISLDQGATIVRTPSPTAGGSRRRTGSSARTSRSRTLSAELPGVALEEVVVYPYARQLGPTHDPNRIQVHIVDLRERYGEDERGIGIWTISQRQISTPAPR